MAEPGEVQFQPANTAPPDALRVFVNGIGASDRTFLDEQLLDPNRIVEWAGERGAVGVVAMLGGDVAGIGSVRPGTGWAAHVALLRVVVGAGHRRRGVGTGVVRGLLPLAGSRGVSKIAVEVMAANAGGVRFFEGLGFAPEATLRDQVRDGRGGYQDLLVMSLWIDGEGNRLVGAEDVAG